MSARMPYCVYIMCGITGYIGQKEATEIILEGLHALEYRGYDSAGIAVFKDGSFSVAKAAGRVAVLEERLAAQNFFAGAHVGIGHTRWATHGVPSDINAHPHGNERVQLVHNGIIENYAPLRKLLLEKGYTFTSETDTEVAAKLIDLRYRECGDHLSALSAVMREMVGSYAMAVLFADAPDRLYALKNAVPLIVGVGEGENFIASDIAAVLRHTKKYYPLGDLQMAVVTAHSIEIMDIDKRPLHPEMMTADWSVEAAERGGYAHFMLKEIMEQPRAIKSTLDPRVKDHRVVFDELKMTDEQLMGFNKIMITACGSAFYAGQAGKYALEKLTHIPVDADLASEFRYRDPIVDEHTLMIIISQSGETADTIAAIREAQSKGAYVLSIVNVVGSTIARISDDVIYTWAGPEIAVATTKGYTTQVSVLYLLALYLGEKRGCLSREEAAKLTDDLMILPQMVQRAIDLNPQIAQLAERYKNNPSLFFIGRNVDYAVCMEGSLKLKEISYLHSEAYAAGELKHGTIALIEENRLVIAVACYEPLFDKTMSNVKEVKARGARVLGVALEGNRAIYSEADDVILVPRMDDLFVVPAEIVPLQLFAYYVAKANGCAIDKPKNLAKSVTVE